MVERMSLQQYRELSSNTPHQVKRKTNKKAPPSIKNADPEELLTPSKNKYNAKKVAVSGIVFDSKLESMRYIFLKEQERKGLIIDLCMQKKYTLEVNGVHVCDYYADFTYKKVSTNSFIVEDVKGVLTPVYRLKKKLMKGLFGLDVFEVKKDNITFMEN